ncbi:succinylglutamate desuccinylase/aspartoacylase family protein [Mangrovibacterium lignilyticum]|uniref:succinylglutamate desuccinylase/aspartoacylase family protein n=1 Tax=Mangrovibacterium lignilyticum TaxID=2668052 RepID=UPI0013D64D27|nr:succinylglutamate desuccinylase/aspartoacylase family protein [Mangrovibacterium lignilyticum]
MKKSDHLSNSWYLKPGKLFLFIVAAIVASIAGNRVLAQNPMLFSVGSILAQPGEKVTGRLNVEQGNDEATFIPITIINGAKSGPVLTLVAGVHGTEYVPIITAQKIIQEIEPSKLSGTLLVVQIANIPAFRAKAVYLSPIDHKNLNRIFPGKKDGTVSECIAYTLSTEIISKSDYYIDMHGGEFTEQVVDYIYYCSSNSDSDLCQKSEMLALAMGNKYLIPDDYSSYPDSLPSKYSEVEASRRGAVSITLEWGDRGMVKTDEVEFALRGIKNVMKTIGMLEGKPFVNEHPVYLINEQSIKSSYDGILYTFVDKEQFVTQGTLIGYTTDYWGNMLEEYHSPITGMVTFVKVAPSITTGEYVYRVDEPLDKIDE